MSAWRTPPGRASRWSDHVIAALAALLATAAAGAVLVGAANTAEQALGLPTTGAVAVLWVLGIALMHLPLQGWPLVLPAIALLLAARRFGAGGWAVAAAIGTALAALTAQPLAGLPGDLLIRLASGAVAGLCYWKALEIRCRDEAPPPFTHR
jgi:hypothetical protein